MGALGSSAHRAIIEDVVARNPADALAAVLAESSAAYDLGPRRLALLEQIDRRTVLERDAGGGVGSGQRCS
jgi:hypothetical protein